MKFDVSSLPAKPWIAPSEVTAAVSGTSTQIHDRLAAKVKDALVSGKVELRGRRAHLVETQVDAEPKEVMSPVNLFPSGMTWIDKNYDERMGMATDTIEVMKPKGDPEVIEVYYLCGESTLDWENDQLRYGSDAEWHEVRFDREQLVAALGEDTGAMTKKAKNKMLIDVETDFGRRVGQWPAGQRYPSQIDDLKAMQEIHPSLKRDAFREIRKRIAPPEWTKPGPRK